MGNGIGGLSRERNLYRVKSARLSFWTLKMERRLSVRVWERDDILQCIALSLSPTTLFKRRMKNSRGTPRIFLSTVRAVFCRMFTTNLGLLTNNLGAILGAPLLPAPRTMGMCTNLYTTCSSVYVSMGEHNPPPTATTPWCKIKTISSTTQNIKRISFNIALTIGIQLNFLLFIPPLSFLTPSLSGQFLKALGSSGRWRYMSFHEQ